MILESKIGTEKIEMLGANKELFENIEIVEGTGKIDFKRFLESDNNTVAINDYKKGYTIYFKSNLTNDLVIIHTQDYKEIPLFNPYNAASPVAIYKVSNNTLYVTTFRLEEELLNLENINIVRLRDFRKELENLVNQKLISIVNNDIDNLNLSEEKIEEYNKDILRDNDNYKNQMDKAIKNIVYNENINLNSYAKFKFDNRCFSIYEGCFKELYIEFEGLNFIKAVNNKDAFANEVVNSILEKYKKSIYTDIVKTNKIVEFINELKDDNDLKVIKSILPILKDDTKKTLNITYKKDNKEMTFKIEGNPYISQSGKTFYINSHDILNGLYREFRETFKNDRYYTADIDLLNIESITYGRKTLYSK